MIAEKRQEEILKILEHKGTVTVQELTSKLNASEATVRRDLTVLDNAGKLNKVFGGAVSNSVQYNLTDDEISKRQGISRNEKIKIARYAAGLIKPNDFVYIDAGTTTGYMIDFIKEKAATFVTNAIFHARQLALKGMRVILVGGEFKISTEAIVGNEAINNLRKYNFNIGFWGANGVTTSAGFTTPDMNEAAVKECAIKQTSKRYILCDSEKFGKISPVTFAPFSSAFIITDKINDDNYKNFGNIINLNS